MARYRPRYSKRSYRVKYPNRTRRYRRKYKPRLTTRLTGPHRIKRFTAQGRPRQQFMWRSRFARNRGVWVERPGRWRQTMMRNRTRRANWHPVGSQKWINKRRVGYGGTETR